MSDTRHTSSDVDSLIRQIEALNREKQQLISLVSHDLRAPLNRAFALSELLLMDQEGLTEFQKDYLEKMRLVIADGLAMMRNLVDYRNLEFKSIDIRLEKVNVKEFLDRLIREFQSIADKKGISILTTHTEQDLLIASDKQCLDRILSNLLSNALKFSAPGKKVLIRTAKKSDQEIQIEIEDEIGGFSPEEEKTLFSKFKRYKALPTGNESSTGLGLFVAYAMAERIGGTIACKTIDTMGSTFIVTLPVKMD
jgi:two-component system sensor histidine kinase/response regulator